MLGLGSFVFKPSGKVRRIVYEYTSSFDSSIGDLVVSTNVSSPTSDDYTLELGQNAPGEATTNDWLKVTLSGDGTGSNGTWTGFRFNLETGGTHNWLPSPHGDFYHRLAGMEVTIEYKIHCAGTWYIDGGHNTSGNIPGLKNQSGSVTDPIASSPGVAIGSTVDVSTSHVHGGNHWGTTLNFPVAGLIFPGTNYPAPGSVLYFKDLVVRLYNMVE